MLLITTFDIGGAERVYIEIARGLARRGYDVIAAALQGRSGLAARELENSGVTILDLRMRGKADLMVLWRLVQALRRRRVAVLYTFLIHAHLLGRAAARLAATPVLLSSQQIMGWESRAGEWLNRLTARWCSAVIGVSNNVAKYLMDDVGLPPSKVLTIYNCVDLERFRQHRDTVSPEWIDIVGSIARLNPEKDYATLFRALQLVRQGRPRARLVVAGAGPERGRLEALADSLRIRQAVEFLGHVEDVRQVHRRIAVHAQISHVEGLPVAVLEAMAAGLPVVATRVGGNEEAVLHGTTGLLVPPGDVEGLARALERLLGDPALGRQMGEAGRRHVQAVFGTDAMLHQTDALIQRLLERRVPEPVHP